MSASSLVRESLRVVRLTTHGMRRIETELWARQNQRAKLTMAPSQALVVLAGVLTIRRVR